MAKHFNTGMNEVVNENRLMYGDYMVPGADVRIYSQITDMTQLVKVSANCKALSCLYHNISLYFSMHAQHSCVVQPSVQLLTSCHLLQNTGPTSVKRHFSSVCTTVLACACFPCICLSSYGV